MIIVIQCAGGKRSDAGYLVSPAGIPVFFVAHPEIAPADDAFVYARPNDPSGNGTSYHQNVRLSAARDLLLPRLISGEIAV